MVFEEGKPFPFLHIKHFLCEFIDRESHFLIFRVGIIIVRLEVVDFLMLDNLFHELDRGVVFSAVLAFLRSNRNGLKFAWFLYQFDFHIGGFPRFQFDILLDIAHRKESQSFPLWILLYDKFTLFVGHGTDPFPVIIYIDKIQWFPASGVNDHSGDLCSCNNNGHKKGQEQQIFK